MPWPLMSIKVRMLWLRALWVLASGSGSIAADGTAVTAALRDPRMRVFPGREGLPRSLGSVHAALVTRFLGGQLRGAKAREVSLQRSLFTTALSTDGEVMYYPDFHAGCIIVVRLADGAFSFSIGTTGSGPLEFFCPSAVCVSPDGFLFVAEQRNNRVQVLSPTLAFHGFLGEHRLTQASDVSADSAIVAVLALDSDAGFAGIHVLSRADSTFLARFASCLDAAAIPRFWFMQRLCIMADGRRIAVSDLDTDQIRMYTTVGECVQTIHLGPCGSHVTMARSPDDDLFVAMTDCDCIRVFDRDGDDVGTIGRDFLNFPISLMINADTLIVRTPGAVVTVQ